MSTKFMMICGMIVGFICLNGCTNISKMHPQSGLPGTAVHIKAEGLWGEPTNYTIKWDGEIICEPFAGTFLVPADATPGEHTVTLIDNLDMAEINLIFPLLRLRHDTETFTITTTSSYNQNFLKEIAAKNGKTNF